MALFIDTNVFLSFYHLSSDDLEELKKLDVLLDREEEALYLPSHVIDEHRRNREAKIADALKRLRDQKLSLQFPQMCKDYAEYADLRRLQETYKACHSQLLEKLEADVQDCSLKADGVIERLFSRGTLIPMTDQIYQRARRRQELGNPPGKRDSLGDAVNWESLLAGVPAKEPLCLVSGDADYSSPLDDAQLNSFLRAEWQEEKGVVPTFYRRLSEYFSDMYPEIKLATELDKTLTIKELAGSRRFRTTHRCIARLAKYGVDFNAQELNALVLAALENNQVLHVLHDKDVHTFYTTILKGREGLVDPIDLRSLTDLLVPEATTEEDDIPF
jgi:predicted nucleic acid-binding protein